MFYTEDEIKKIIETQTALNIHKIKNKIIDFLENKISEYEKEKNNVNDIIDRAIIAGTIIGFGKTLIYINKIEKLEEK